MIFKNEPQNKVVRSISVLWKKRHGVPGVWLAGVVLWLGKEPDAILMV